MKLRWVPGVSAWQAHPLILTAGDV